MAVNAGAGDGHHSRQHCGWGWLPRSLMLVVVVATVDAPAAGTCQPVVINAGTGMAAVAVDTGDGGTHCRGWGPSRPSTLELGLVVTVNTRAGGCCDHQRWGWGVIHPSMGVGAGCAGVNTGECMGGQACGGCACMTHVWACVNVGERAGRDGVRVGVHAQ